MVGAGRGAEERRRTVRFRVRGRVQGVGFRMFVLREAEERGLDGSVRNDPDGSVEGVVAGPQERVAAFLETLRKGPPAASVEALETGESGGEVERSGFSIRR